MRVTDASERLRFTLEAFELRGTGTVRRKQDLDRHRAIKARVARTIHLAHASDAQRRHDFIWADLRTSCERRSAGRHGCSRRSRSRRPPLASSVCCSRSPVLYAVVAFLVTQRTREFGIRMALGASVRQLVSGMMGETMRTAAIGLAGGAAVALMLNRAMSGAIMLVPPIALRPYVVAIGIMLLATATAALLPSLRTTRINPSKALRVE